MIWTYAIMEMLNHDGPLCSIIVSGGKTRKLLPVIAVKPTTEMLMGDADGVIDANGSVLVIPSAEFSKILWLRILNHQPQGRRIHNVRTPSQRCLITLRHNLRPTFPDVEERHTLAVIVEMNRCLGACQPVLGRGCNIET
jgi:hypothetical protein